MKAALGIMGACSLVVLLSQFGCKDDGTNPTPGNGPPPTKLGCPFAHIEIDDTTRTYVFWDGSKHELSPSYVFVRFVKTISDSTALNIASKYGLKRRFHAAGVWVFCVPKGKRAEQFFTPYGKAQVQSFGSEPLVEVAYGIFYDGSFGYLDDFVVEFDSLVTRSAIDSINSLYHVVIDTTFVVGERLWYLLLVTKQSPYSSFDMSNFYHCLPEVRDSTAHANVSVFNPPLGAKCVLPSSAGKSVITNKKIRRYSP